jgi:hypothetical protein
MCSTGARFEFGGRERTCEWGALPCGTGVGSIDSPAAASSTPATAEARGEDGSRHRRIRLVRGRGYHSLVLLGLFLVFQFTLELFARGGLFVALFFLFFIVVAFAARLFIFILL